jgi:ParB-like chromosome segregation protein Spo0J
MQTVPISTVGPADKVERRPVAELVPYARNARTHSPARVAKIAVSIQEWGWTNSVLVDESGSIIAGHGRVLAARKVGIVDVPVMVASSWTEAQRRAYVLADNRLALDAGWDEDLLRSELVELGGSALTAADRVLRCSTRQAAASTRRIALQCLDA